MVSPIANNNNKAHVSALYSRVHAAASVSCSKSTALYTDSSRAGSKMHNVSRTSVFVTLYGIYYLAKNPPKIAINCAQFLILLNVHITLVQNIAVSKLVF